MAVVNARLVPFLLRVACCNPTVLMQQRKAAAIATATHGADGADGTPASPAGPAAGPGAATTVATATGGGDDTPDAMRRDAVRIVLGLLQPPPVGDLRVVLRMISEGTVHALVHCALCCCVAVYCVLCTVLGSWY